MNTTPANFLRGYGPHFFAPGASVLGFVILTLAVVLLTGCAFNLSDTMGTSVEVSEEFSKRQSLIRAKAIDEIRKNKYYYENLVIYLK